MHLYLDCCCFLTCVFPAALFKSYAANANEAQAKKYLAEGWVKRAAELKVHPRTTISLLHPTGLVIENLGNPLEHASVGAAA